MLEDSASAEIAVVGNERLIGTSLFMGVETIPSRAVVLRRSIRWHVVDSGQTIAILCNLQTLTGNRRNSSRVMPRIASYAGVRAA